jgi:hypothetical protein
MTLLHEFGLRCTRHPRKTDLTTFMSSRAELFRIRTATVNRTAQHLRKSGEKVPMTLPTEINNLQVK